MIYHLFEKCLYRISSSASAVAVRFPGYLPLRISITVIFLCAISLFSLLVSRADDKGIPVYKFDFGLESSPVGPGFKQVTPDTVYSPDKGYGWGWRAETPRGQSVWPEIIFPDALLIDWIEANGMFNLDLPNGSYQVFIIMRKVLDSNNRFSSWISAEGESKVSIDKREVSLDEFWYLNDFEPGENIWPERLAPFYLKQTFTVEVADGQLSLMFFPASVAALIVYPESKAAEVEARIQNRQLKREKRFSNLPRVPAAFLAWGRKGREVFIPPGWQEVKTHRGRPCVTMLWSGMTFRGWGVEQEKMPFLTSEDKERGYVVFRRNYLDLVYHHCVPLEEEITDKIETFITLGEYEPLTFTIRALENLKRVKITGDDLVSEDGHIIGKENIDIRVVRCLPRQAAGHKKYTLEPLVLEKREKVDIKKNTSQRIWITVYVPEEAKPGLYTTKISIRPENRSPKELTLKIRVLPIKLKTPDTVFGIYHNMDTRWEGFYPGNMKKHFIDMREHGLNSISLYATPRIERRAGKVELDFARPALHQQWSLEEVVKAYIDAGLTGPVLFAGLELMIVHFIRHITGLEIFSTEFDEIFQDMVREIKRKQEEKGWPEFLFSPQDEAANSPERMKRCKHYLKLLKEAIPQARTAVTLNGFWVGIDDGAIFDPWLDVRVYNWVTEKVIEETRKARDTFWIYNGGSIGRNPVVDRLFYGFYAVRTGATGVTQWVYQWPGDGPRVGPFRELEAIDKGGQHGWYYTFPSPQGPLPTPAWQGIREGIDDARYLYTLKTLIEKARESGDSIIEEKARKAEEDIERILQSIKLELQTREREKAINFISRNSSLLNEWRREIAERIIKLQELLRSG